MPIFNPIEIYKNQDVYVIGGGSSVIEHDLSVLKHLPVIGLNQAFAAIPELLDFCVFGDTAFFNFIIKNFDKLKEFKGKMITNAAMPIGVTDYSWIYSMEKSPFMKKGKTLGWYGNTGILGIELAITLGAKRIYLLGFDNCNREDGLSHYHKYHKAPISKQALIQFNDQFQRANKIWKEDFPEIEIINLNESSHLGCFKKENGFDHLRRLK